MQSGQFIRPQPQGEQPNPEGLLRVCFSMKAIVFTLNSCSLAALGPYGNEWIATPNLDQLAAESVTFDRHISCGPDPVIARKTWLKGSILEQLQAHGVHTVLIRHNRPENDGPSEFYAGWGELFDARPGLSTSSPSDPLLELLPEVLKSLEKHEKFLLWIDCDRLLPPWDAPQELFDIYVEELIEDDPKYKAEEIEYEDDENESQAEEAESEPEPEPEPVKESVPPWLHPTTGWFDKDDLNSWELLHRTYAAAVTAFDADLGKLFYLFRAHQLDEQAHLLFTSDRGYPLGEHAMIGPHRPWLHEELVHLPFLIRPAGKLFGKRVPVLTQPVDFIQTLASLYGLQLPDGLNLLPWLSSLSGPGREFAISELTGERAIRTLEWTLLKPGPAHPDDDEPREEAQLYQMPDDRWEVNDVWRQYEAIVEELTAKLSHNNGEQRL
jgi:arylsulfatase A-like enzyme